MNAEKKYNYSDLNQGIKLKKIEGSFETSKMRNIEILEVGELILKNTKYKIILSCPVSDCFIALKNEIQKERFKKS